MQNLGIRGVETMKTKMWYYNFYNIGIKQFIPIKFENEIEKVVEDRAIIRITTTICMTNKLRNCIDFRYKNLI